MNKILVCTNPIGPFQKVVAVKDDKVIEQIGVVVDNLPEIVYAFAKKHNINEIYYMGVKEYAIGLMKDAQFNPNFSVGLQFKYYGGSD